MVLEDPPFDETTLPKSNFGTEKVPCREVHYSYDKASKLGLVMIYGDAPYINYWTSFSKKDEALPQNNENPHLKHHISHYLRKLFADETCAKPYSILHYGIMDWSKVEPPPL